MTKPSPKSALDKPDKSSKPTLRDSGTFILSGHIDESTVKPCIKWILEECIRKTHKELNLIISSGGGYVTDCFGLIDIMEGSRIPVNTLGLGCIASCGLTIFLYGKHRVVTENTYIMSHQYSSQADGKHHELLAERKSQDWFQERTLSIYAKKTGLSRAMVEKHLLGPSDSHLSAKEALKLGICHEIR